MKRLRLLAWGDFALTVVISLITIGLIPPSRSLDLVDALATITNILDALMVALVGTVISARLGRNAVGWILLIAGLSLAIESFLGVYTLIAFQGETETLLGGIAAAWLSGWIWITPTLALVMLLHVFPTGRFLSRRWRWIAFVSAFLFAAAVIPVAFSTRLDVISDQGELLLPNPVGLFTFPDWVYPLIFLPWLAGLIGALSSMLLRFIRAGGIERQQIKWFLYAAVIFVSAIILTFYQTATVFQILINVIALGIPIAMGIAILRYRLFEIDIIIRRTLIYSTLTLILVLVYFGCVAILQNLLSAVSGQRSEIAIIVSTLAIAALFNPLRHRVQRAIDHRFYRRKYDAQQVLARFAITVRDKVELEKLNAELLNVIDETMQPKSVSLWLKHSEKR